MKAITTFLTLVVAAGSAAGQGALHLQNTSSTLISADGVPMPVSGAQEFYFALFLAPATTVNAPGQTTPFTDPSFQIVAAYNTNASTAPGRLTPRLSLFVGESQGFYPGSTVDFVVRGWSANAGTTWNEALGNWNAGSPVIPMYIGSSKVGNNLVLSGGTSAYPTIFGTSGLGEIPGFDMLFVPEPSALAQAVFGGAILWATGRWRKRKPG